MVAVPGISDRLALLNSGELKAAMFPDPLNAVAMGQGAVPVIDNSKHPEYSFSVYTFRKEAIDQHPEAIRAFLAGLEEATRKINADPGQWKKLLVEQKILPAPLEATFQVPKFATAGVPTRDQYKDILDWAKAKAWSTPTSPTTHGERRFPALDDDPVRVGHLRLRAWAAHLPGFLLAGGARRSLGGAGPSGCGKTTLLYLLAGLALPISRAGAHRRAAADPPAPAHRADPAGLRPAALGHRARERRAGPAGAQLLRPGWQPCARRTASLPRRRPLAGTPGLSAASPGRYPGRSPAGSASAPPSPAPWPSSPTCC